MGASCMAKGRRRTSPKFWLLLTAAVLLVSACFYGTQAYYLRQQNQTLAELEARRSALADNKVQRERRLEFMDSNEYIIREARDKLGLLMPGEILFEDAR